MSIQHFLSHCISLSYICSSLRQRALKNPKDLNSAYKKWLSLYTTLCQNSSSALEQKHEPYFLFEIKKIKKNKSLENTKYFNSTMFFLEAELKIGPAKENKAYKAYVMHRKGKSEKGMKRIRRSSSTRSNLFFLCAAVLVFTLLFFIFNDISSNTSSSTSKKMPLEMVDATLSTFDQVFQKFNSDAPNYRANLILFVADKDPSTNLSWCPDCVRAEPVIYKKLEAFAGDVALLRAYVGDRPTWRNPAHPWRNDPRFKLRGVPTLVRWENDAVTGRLEDYEAHLENKIESLMAK